MKKNDEYVAFSNISICYAWKNMKKSYKKDKFKISVQSWNHNFDLSGGSYSVLHAQDYSQHFIKKHETLTDNHPIRIYVNKTENRITFKIKIA